MMAIWALGQQFFYRLFPNLFIMVFNTALSLVCAAIAIYFIIKPYPYFNILNIILSIFLLFLSGAILFEHLFDNSLGIDELFVKVNYQNELAHPGRMSPQTSFCFMMLATTMLLFHAKSKRLWFYSTLILIISIIIFSLVGLFGGILNLNVIYDWNKFGKMATPTALGLLFLGTSLFMHWYQTALKRKIDLQREKTFHRIISIVILTVFFDIGFLFMIILFVKLNRHYY